MVQQTPLQLTQHARHRAAQRAVPQPVIGLILEYGESRHAGQGAQKFALSKASLRDLRRDLGARIPGNIDRYRSAYVVAAEGKVVTVAFASRPLFH
ncbi:hypothetical protein [Tranquillimonas alkanivorans]|uniref:Uncharacterized protein n=1 Tax=Tranquillimonas alkanivorans TaxID=441119 RepID=A0A1I5VCG8_9RHOB|nr:hypothetical protein [Tranquillimonas alkanivorans]SFQ05150.1 hypothetical protein SAMN04488047_12917 [Tranquillimonas alkanivorans]